jgi:hypothetical protein
MATDDTDHIVDQIEAQARYETLREVVNQLAGVLVSRQRSAPPHEQVRWREEHKAIRARLDAIDPGTPDVDDALDQWSARLRELRAGSG